MRKVIIRKLVLLLAIISISGCYRHTAEPAIVAYKENDTFDRPVETTMSNFWGLKEIGGIEEYQIKNIKKVQKVYELLNEIEYHPERDVIFPLYSLIVTNQIEKDTFYIDDTGKGYSTRHKRYFNSKDIYTFLRKEIPNFFSQ